MGRHTVEITEKSSSLGLLVSKWSISRSVVAGTVVITSIILSYNMTWWQCGSRRDRFSVIFRFERILAHHILIIESSLVIRYLIFFQFTLIVIFQYPPRYYFMYRIEQSSSLSLDI